MLRGIGYFITSLWDETLPAPQELVGTDSRLPAVADYLDRGMVHVRYRGRSWCRFGCRDVAMGSADLTDGVWVWPEGLAHYLRFHSVLLPEDFMGHVLSAGPPQPADEAADVDWETWIEWSRSYRSPNLRSAVLAAQREEDRLMETAKLSRIRMNIARYGESDVNCIQASCDRRALLGIRFCAHHLPEMSEEDAFRNFSPGPLIDALQDASMGGV
jgi:hypothetical protein